MKPRIEPLTEKKLIGKRMTMSLARNKTGELWKSFIPRRNDITNQVSTDLISMQRYKPSHFTDFKPTNEFEKWATVEVASFDKVPTDMETFTIPGGLYAIFDYKGSSSDPTIFQYIFGTWLPGSCYDLDDRPHFEILGDKYKNNDSTSEEEICIPVKKKRESVNISSMDYLTPECHPLPSPLREIGFQLSMNYHAKLRARRHHC